LLDVKRGRWDFPELKRIAKEQYDLWQPDNVLIEAKATGTPLQQGKKPPQKKRPLPPPNARRSRI
jgi:hypothetical protein